METSAFAPAHITGLVIPDEISSDPLHAGSKGIGFSIQEGVTTKVKAQHGTGEEVKVRINGKPAPDAKVSIEAAKTILRRAGGKKYNLTIEHLVQVPIGVGFGTSGAAALSLTLAVNKALDLGLSTVEAAQAAHVAEVACRTGLGTVLAELHGGFEIRVAPGAPGIGELIHIPLNREYSVVFLTFGALSTGKMLDSLEQRHEAYTLAENLLTGFMQKRSVENFLYVSNQFSRFLALNDKLERVLTTTEGAGFICGVALFGQTVFTIVKPEETVEVERTFKRLMTKGAKILITRISDQGARVL
ncbi:MAG: hypothetical protein M1503_00115 [Thaumarchaeota archaeon]|nr:hypothetical protein [Nitrososphaerota archaeon]MCL5316655.1 hypothetical protein [Nitrososphaerota archaeon]